MLDLNFLLTITDQFPAFVNISLSRLYCATRTIIVHLIREWPILHEACKAHLSLQHAINERETYEQVNGR